MPEGPECHKVARRIESAFKGSTVGSVVIHGGRYQKHGPPGGYKAFGEMLAVDKPTITAAGARGKLIVIFLSNNWRILTTLGLSGSWVRNRTKHCDFSIVTDAGTLWFKDQLHYGTVKFVEHEEMLEKLLALGPDVTVKDPAFTRDYWETLRRRYPHWDVTKLLMDQSKVSGIGNYLKAEILYAAKVSPDSLLGNIPDDVSKLLWEMCLSIPHHFHIVQMTSRFKVGLKVYRKKKDPSGNAVRTMKAGDCRTSHWVPDVQVAYK